MVKGKNVKNNASITTAIILAGGLSTRMGGKDKSLLQVGDKTLIEHILNRLQDKFFQIMIGANSTQDFGFLKNIIVVRDIEQGKGPLMGLYSCLSASNTDINLVTTCDNPKPNLKLAREMIKALANHDAVVPMSINGKIDPLFAVYRKSVAQNAKNLLDKGVGKVMKLLDIIDVSYFNTAERDEIKNINSSKEFEEFLKKT